MSIFAIAGGLALIVLGGIVATQPSTGMATVGVALVLLGGFLAMAGVNRLLR